MIAYDGTSPLETTARSVSPDWETNFVSDCIAPFDSTVRANECFLPQPKGSQC